MTLQDFKKQIMPIQHRLFRLANRLLGRREEAEDAVQETLIKLWHKRKNLHEYRSVEALAFTIIKNYCLDKLKSKGFQAVVSISDFHMTRKEENPEKQYENINQAELVRKLMNDLPNQQKVIIHLRDVEGLEYEEIADITGLTVNSLRVNISRARRKIRDQLVKIHQYEYQRN